MIFRLELVTVPSRISTVPRPSIELRATDMEIGLRVPLAGDERRRRDLDAAVYVDRAGFSVEQDRQVDNTHRFVELMPRLACSIALTARLRRQRGKPSRYNRFCR